MAKRRSESNRNSNGRRDFTRFLLMVLPGFMFVGLLAPAAVSVKPKADAEEHYPPVSFRNFTPRRPMHIARAITNSEPAVEPLFSGARYVAGEAGRVIELPAVEAAAARDEQIVLAKEDAVDDYVSDTMFDQSVGSPVLTVDLEPLWDPATFDRIPGTISWGGFTQWDDFHGNGVEFSRIPPVAVPIPEPQSGALVALGVLALALRARQRARA